MLCEICLKLVQQIDHLLAVHTSGEAPNSQNLTHHQTVDSVIHAVEVVRCVVCTRVAHEAPALIDRDLEQWLNSREGKSGLEYNALVNLSTWQRNGEVSLRFMAHNYGGVSVFRLRPLSDSIVAALTPKYDLISSHTGDDTVLDLAKSWLGLCESSHEECRLHFNSRTTYPARLLDLQPDGFDDTVHFRLIEGQDMRKVSGSYMTLSHRWGSPENHPPKLSAISHASLIQGWPISRLSGTYQDAVTITKKLNVRYLWVDSLCIFQDEQLDILTEALKMGSVYGNAICNISALDARQDGLFSYRDATTMSPLSRIVLKPNNAGLQRSYAIGDHRLWEDSIFNAPLSKRGWILQEQLLARRTLFFGHEQLLWSCVSGAWCETYPMDNSCWDGSEFNLSQKHLDPVRLYCATANRALSLNSKQSPVGSIDPKLKRDFQMAWRHILEEYVPRQLTEPSDKLLAINGLVSSFAATQNDECIAGHWKSSFPFNLLWHVRTDRPVSNVQPSPVSRVPSWSWASQDRHLIIPGELDRRYCAPIAMVLNIEQQSSKSKINGVHQEAVGGLTLVSPQLSLVRLQVEGEINAKWNFRAFTAEHTIPSSPDPLGEHIETYFDISESEIQTDTLVGAFISCEVQISQSSSADTESKRTLIRCEGIILQPTPPPQVSKVPRYRRIGHFKFGDILTGSSASRFMPAKWRFHLDIETRDGRTFTQRPNFGDEQLMQTVEIL